jgi:regulatory protein
MENDENFQKLRNYALKLLSFRPRTEKEISGKLKQFSIKRGINTKLVEELIQELTSQGLINDKEFAAWWIDQRDNFRPKGKRALVVELRNKGVVPEIIEEVLTFKKSDEDEYQSAKKLIDKKLSVFRNLSRDELKMKIGNFLSRRGFSWEIIYKVIDGIVKKL